LNQQQYYGCDRAERHDFLPQLWLFFTPFFFPLKKRGKKKERMNTKNRDQKSCLSARSIVVAEHSYTAPQLHSYSAVATTHRFKAIY